MVREEEGKVGEKKRQKTQRFHILPELPFVLLFKHIQCCLRQRMADVLGSGLQLSGS